MFQHILVPTDLSEKSQKALDIAVRLASQGASRITLLHVVETIEDADCDEFDSFYRSLGKRSWKKMEKMLDPYRGQDVAVEREVAYGKRVRAIIQFARDREIDLVVLSSHRVDTESLDQGWGTISYQVGILSPCPVMLVK